MRYLYPLTFRLLLVISGALLLLTLTMLLVTEQQVRAILDQSQSERYQRQINSIINSLQLQEEKLQATGIPESYRQGFQEYTVNNLRSTYYLRSDRIKVPIIFTDDGKVVLHPDLSPGTQIAKGGWDLSRVRQLQNGEFLQNDVENGKTWYIFESFRPWRWVVGYAIPAQVKYADVTSLQRNLALTFLIILIPVGLAIAWYIRRQLLPVRELTRAAQRMGDGDLEHPLPTGHNDEIGLLASSFLQMRDHIRRELDLRNRRAERSKIQQEALLVLSQTDLLHGDDPQPYLELATEQLVKTLQCNSASIWLLDASRDKMTCHDCYVQDYGHYRNGQQFSIADHPGYLDSIAAGPLRTVQPSADGIDLTAPPVDGMTALSSFELPLRIAGVIHGLIRLDFPAEKDSWHEDETAFAMTVTEQIVQKLVHVEAGKAEQELTHLRQELANIVNSMPSILIGIDQDRCIRHWNLEAQHATGITPDAARGRKAEEVFPQLKRQLDLVSDALLKRQLQACRKLSWVLGGRQVYIDLTIYPMLDAGKTGAVIRIDDVSERVRIEEMMVQTEKMMSIGGLAAGMAHEINNPLAGIMQNVQVIRNRLDPKLAKNDKVARECGTDIETIVHYIDKRGMQPMLEALTTSGNRAARIVDNMLSFSRKSESQQAPHNLNELIDRTLELAANDYDLKKNYDFRKISIVRESGELPEVKCTATEIQQVLLNLLKNGAQAMSADPACNAPQFILRTRREDRFAVIEVQDNGPGIPEEIRRRVFEPFFTTRAVGIGTGLGLSVSYFIICEKHGGSMEISSSPGQGTCFFIRLPIEGKAVPAPPEYDPSTTGNPAAS